MTNSKKGVIIYLSPLRDKGKRHIKQRKGEIKMTLARAIYKKMEIGKPYATSDLLRLIGDDYYKIVPQEFHPFQPNGKPANKVISEEMWKVVNSGFAKTYKREEKTADVRGRKFGSKPTGFTTYSVRYWVRTK